MRRSSRLDKAFYCSLISLVSSDSRQRNIPINPPWTTCPQPTSTQSCVDFLSADCIRPDRFESCDECHEKDGASVTMCRNVKDYITVVFLRLFYANAVLQFALLPPTDRTNEQTKRNPAEVFIRRPTQTEHRRLLFQSTS